MRQTGIPSKGSDIYCVRMGGYVHRREGRERESPVAMREGSQPPEVAASSISASLEMPGGHTLGLSLRFVLRQGGMVLVDTA